jgi:hypothetical protein
MIDDPHDDGGVAFALGRLASRPYGGDDQR